MRFLFRKIMKKEKYIEKATEVHGQKFDYSETPLQFKWGDKIKVKCIKHHFTFMIRHDHHLRQKFSCHQCLKENSSLPRKKRTTERFIQQAKEVHGEKYGYGQSVYSTDNLIKIFCYKCNQYFYQSYDSHISGCDCQKCANDSCRKTKQQFIKQGKEKYNGKYDYNSGCYVNCHTLFQIKCNDCGNIFFQSPMQHLRVDICNGTPFGGCQVCRMNKIRIGKQQFQKRARAIHGDKYDYSQVEYINKDIKVKIWCNKCKQYFYQSTHCHIHNESGCLKCSIKNDMSKNHQIILNLLKYKNIKYVLQKRFDDCRYKNTLPFDFYLQDYNVLIEYDGQQHFYPVQFWGGQKGFDQCKIRDGIKNNYCVKNNIKLYRINYKQDVLQQMNRIFEELNIFA